VAVSVAPWRVTGKIPAVRSLYEQYQFTRVLKKSGGVISDVDLLISEQKPWRSRTDPPSARN